MGKSSFHVTAKAASKASEISVYGDIGAYGITAGDFVSKLNDIPKDHEITLRVNSYGGSVTEAFAIFNRLKERGVKVSKVDGIAASMGSILALSGDQVEMAADSWMVIHNPHGGTSGDFNEMRNASNVLEGMRDQLAAIYAKKSGKTEEEIKAAMAKETWLTAAQAVEFGLADSVGPALNAAAKINLQDFRNVPPEFKAKAEGQKPTAPTTPTQEMIEPMFDSLLKALVEAKLIPSAKLDDKEAAAAFEASWSALEKDKSSDAKTIEGLNAKISEFHAKEADAFVAELVRDGKVSDEDAQKASIKSLFMKDPEASRTWAGTIKAQQKPKAPAGGNPLPAASASAGGDKTLTQRCMDARGIK